MVSLAIKMLFADRGKFLVATAGVVFSVALVNIQGGLFLGLLRKAALLVQHGQADVWIGHRQMHNVDFPRDIPRQWVDRVRTVPGVQDAEPYLIAHSDMTLPNGGYEVVFLVGADREKLLGSAWNIVEGDVEDLRQSDAIIVDCADDAKLRMPRVGEVREIGRQRARVVAKSQGIAGFLVAPYVFTTFERAASYSGKDLDQCSYILVDLHPDANAQTVASAIRQRLPDTEVYVKDDYASISIDFWMRRTGLGISFGAATLLGLAIGLVMVGQTMYAMVLDRLAEFGTLKAMGATLSQIASILLVQACVLALLGSAVGLLVVAIIQSAFNTPHAPIVVPWWLSLGSCALVWLICLLSAVLPYLRVRRVDPLFVLHG